MKQTLITATCFAATKSIASTTIGNHLSLAEQLTSTSLIETNHPKIITLAKRITSDAKSQQAAAMLLHNWVRDEIPFGIPSKFYKTTATESLDEKVGYCNTKVTLFNALLRASGIPARMRVVELSAQVLQGLFNPGTPYVDHALTEVFLDGKWIKIDSYVVDTPLVTAASKKLRASKSKAGFGIHLDGQSEWDGRSDNFIQYMNNDAIQNYVLKDHGVFVDVADYYRSAEQPRNRLSFISGLGIRLGHSAINKKIHAIRTAG